MDLSSLYTEHFESLLRFARSLCRDNDLSEDLVQEAFARAMANCTLLSVLPDYKIRSWLFTVVRNYHVDWIRKNSKQKRLITEASQQPDFVNSVEGLDLISRLPDRQKDILFKRFWLGMNSKEISRVLNIPASTVRTRLQQALQCLRRQIMHN